MARTSPEEMDDYAKKAKEELIYNLDTWSAGDVAEWFQRHFMGAGHKRLGRMLVDIANERNPETTERLRSELLAKLGL